MRLIPCPDPCFFSSSRHAPVTASVPAHFFLPSRSVPERPGKKRVSIPPAYWDANVLWLWLLTVSGVARFENRSWPGWISLPIPASPPSLGDSRSVTDYEGHYGPDGRRRMVLTDHDIEAIRKVACSCPHGMTAEDVFKLRSFLSWWDDIKSTVGGYVLKGGIALIIAIGVLLAWISKGGGQG